MITYFNKNIYEMAPSASIEIMAKAKRMKAADPEIVDLAGGEPDFDTPDKICQELFKQINAGYTHYTVGPGLPELREKIAEKLNRENGCSYSPEGVVVTPGGKYGIYIGVRVLTNPGDEVIYLNPGWVSYPSIIQACGCVPVAVNLDYDANYEITEELLEEKYSSKTRMLIINYPNNPTGRVLTEKEANVIRSFMLKHKEVMLLSDEMYERIVYAPHKNVSPGSFEDIAERVVTVNGFSKSVAMTGWRIGYLAAAPEVACVAGKLFSHTISCVSGFIQKSAIKAFECNDEIEAMRQQYEKRRDLFVNGLNAIPGVSCKAPEGAFYAWTNFDIPGMDSTQVCNFILEKAKVVGVPAISYGEEKGSRMRFSFAAAEDQLEQAVINIRKAMTK